MTEYMWILVALTYFGVIIYQIKSKTHNTAFSLIGLLILKITMELPNSIVATVSSLIVLIAVLANLFYVYKRYLEEKNKNI